jgi:hypothetical protein
MYVYIHTQNLTEIPVFQTEEFPEHAWVIGFFLPHSGAFYISDYTNELKTAEQLVSYLNGGTYNNGDS